MELKNSWRHKQGTRFVDTDESEHVVYQISGASRIWYFISWMDKEGNIVTDKYDKKEVERMFTEGRWLEYKSPVRL